jgi:plasmid maintenance system antidote protein VapI
MTDTTTFEPDWASPPGDTIRHILGRRRHSVLDLAPSLQLSLVDVEALISGDLEINPLLAQRLEVELGLPAQFWERREQQYREDQRRLAERARVPASRDWVRQLPVSDMVKFGWISRTSSLAAKEAECLRFFGVKSIADWHAAYQSPLLVAAFRTSAAYPSSPPAVAAWLRQAELAAEDIDCSPWDRNLLRQKIPELRSLTRRKEPALFLDELRSACAQCGVALVVLPAPTGCRASGATKFIDAGRKALLALSFRYKSDDQFWFSFFHEIGHLILHEADMLFLEDGGEVTFEEEAQANDFAAQTLIPPQWNPMVMSVSPRTREVIRLAVKIGVSPGILVGQLQHLGRIGPERLNGLKRRFDWASVQQITHEMK